jgi:hypothetical protein
MRHRQWGSGLSADRCGYAGAARSPLSEIAQGSLEELLRPGRSHQPALIFADADGLIVVHRSGGGHVQNLLQQGRIVEATGVLWRFWRNGTVVNQFRFAEAKRYLPDWLRLSQQDPRGEALGDFQPLALGLGREADVRARQVADLRTFSIPSLAHFDDRMSMSESREIRA